MLGISSFRLSSGRNAAAALPRVSSGLASALLSPLNDVATTALTANFSSFSLSSSTPSLASTVISGGWRRQPINIVPAQSKNIRGIDRSFSSKSKDGGGKDTISGSSQHDTWVDFQRSIAVSGFETGQTVVEKNLGRKSRGGRLSRKKKEKEAELAAATRGQDVTNLKGGEFPALRYSDEETERLLAEAYAAIPPRAGKRGTRNLKRQKRRWFIKRQYDKKKKFERMAEHERRMAKRHEISVAMYQIRENSGDVRQKDQAYQQEILNRWAKIMGHADSKPELNGNEQKELLTS